MYTAFTRDIPYSIITWYYLYYSYLTEYDLKEDSCIEISDHYFDKQIIYYFNANKMPN